MPKTQAKPGFRITDAHGFHVTFDNGVTVSVQFGGGNYGDNYNMTIGTEASHKILESKAAEVAVFGPDGKWLTAKAPGGKDDNVLGWKAPAEVLAILNWAAAYQEGSD